MSFAVAQGTLLL